MSCCPSTLSSRRGEEKEGEGGGENDNFPGQRELLFFYLEF